MRTPLHPVYPAVDELERRARALVAAAPRVLRLRPAGESRAGHPLWLLSAGHGDRQILTVAGAHANEPVGGTSVLRLAALFAHRPEVLERLGCTWHFLLCLDPDGARLAHGWTPEEPQPSLEECHRAFYRPAFARQPESLPGPDEPRAPLPESRALVGLLDELRPVAQFTLHGIEVGAAFMMATREVPGAADAFRRTAARLRIPLDRHPCDGPDWRLDAPGVLLLPDDRGGGERDPSGFVAESTWLYPRRYGTLTVLVETPAWCVPAMSDARPAGAPEREIARVGDVLLGHTRELVEALGDRTAADVPDDLMPLYDAACELVEVAPSIVRTWAAEEPSPYQGHFATLGISARRIPLRAAAMMRRALARTRPDTAAVLADLVREWCQELQKSYDLRWVPVSAQTGLHVRTMLDTARLVCAAGG
ncbi:3-hydroxyacyl-CoA dehydrogenase [Streptomyces sp. Tue6028]|uniref:M14 family zinc carboxypeptidase n=1 Tax=Streptomyces sp. Tue6028 TaxID=2036037 RepID=UPI000BB30422|nr:M14 family zinc carboxypeptidase [Streptomyces sp. Tue6028]PBC63616.1 3-hydroxyacyl-CoA dehydrogenase [Streptomyces sp. Tue6028]